MVKLPKRYRGDVGKDIGGCTYVYRPYEDTIPGIAEAKEAAGVWAYNVVKHNRRTGSISLIQCPEFSAVEEPAVGDCLLVRPPGASPRLRMVRAPYDPFIYHHKFLFVRPDCGLFDVGASMKRSLAWMALTGIDYHRIGRRSYWVDKVLPRLEAP